MITLSETLTSPVGQEAAFAYVADWSRQAEWDPNTESSERIGSGGPEVGAAYELKVKMGPRSVPMEYRITELAAPSRIVLVGEGSGIWTRDTITFAERDAGTRVNYVAEIELSGLLGVLQPLLGRAFDGIAKGAMAGLQRELDRIAAAGSEA